ncbi:hypothetical protein NEOLEDRAFT_1061330, partial [Neolentinus lepideus HHB14362 ss-1]
DDLDQDDAEEFNVSDAVGKALALVAQIRKSMQAKAYFKKTCQEVGVLVLKLLLWIRTHWASLFNFLDRILDVCKVL